MSIVYYIIHNTYLHVEINRFKKEREMCMSLPRILTIVV